KTELIHLIMDYSKINQANQYVKDLDEMFAKQNSKNELSTSVDKILKERLTGGYNIVHAVILSFVKKMKLSQLAKNKASGKKASHMKYLMRKSYFDSEVMSDSIESDYIKLLNTILNSPSLKKSIKDLLM
ncbi:MAG: hypothetical protein MHPSP_001408, partial [Paramarteilia canceri]